MLRRILLTAAAVITVGGVSMAPAGAGDNYGGCSATVSDTTPSAGDVVTITGSGASDGGDVSASLGDEEVGTGTADAEGDFEFEATIPSDASGEETLTVSCGAGNGEFPITVDVLAATAGTTGGTTDGQPLPATGSSSTAPLAAAGIGTILGGAALVAIARRSARAA